VALGSVRKASVAATVTTSSDDDDGIDDDDDDRDNETTTTTTTAVRSPIKQEEEEEEEEEAREDGRLRCANASGANENANENKDEDATMRANNAYPGASNTIGSVHQRHWFITLDRPRSGFRKARTTGGGDPDDAGTWRGEWEAFYVRGREHEHSIVTGRRADDIMADEGVKGFRARKMWRPITE
jgi:hypothetical protein